jgi:tetratricopeptide (TPR) repeat protein
LDPAVEIFKIASEQHRAGVSNYQRELATIYLAQGEVENWGMVITFLEAVLEAEQGQAQPNVYEDLADCFLGLGDFPKFHSAISPDANRVALAHIVSGEYQKAIAKLRGRLTYLGNLKNWPRNEHDAAHLLDVHRDLGLYYEAVGQEADAQNSFMAAVKCFEKYAEEIKGTILDRKEGHSYHRSNARPLYKYGLMLEKLGGLAEAKEFYYCADFVCHITTFLNDDEVLVDEAREMKEALERATKALEENGVEKRA